MSSSLRTLALAAALAATLSATASPTFAAPPAAATPKSGEQRAPLATARFAGYGHNGTFLLQRDGRPTQVVHNAALADTPLRPASTFKVMLGLIALETGALKSADEIVRWDGTPYPKHPEWQRDMTLRQAMQSSSEGYFRILAKRIGRERLAQWVTRVGYGNGRIGDSAPDVWHDGVLTVTARQQLAFVDRLRRGDLPFSKATIAAVKAAMREDGKGATRIYGKTGTHLDKNDHGNAWWIGWIEGPRGSASFALGAQLDSADNRAQRIALGKELLKDAGLLAK
ncbi:MAG: class D beta-lactamase [Xanthomonadaceae bacterium]|nr:class D beta-lactamase [Xanthomonadaceae bacterium]